MKFVNGQPCWVDIMVKDSAQQQAITTFLTDLFGIRWEIGGPETGFYGMGFIGDGQVLAVGQNEHGMGVPSVYLHCDDARATVEKARSLGANVFLEPMDVFDAGTLAMAMDPTGTVFGMWQGNTMPGFGVMETPGSFAWFDNRSSASVKAGEFYAELFGLDFNAMGDGGMLVNDGAWLASISTAPAGSPTFWNPIFATADVVATEALAVSLGCDVLMSGMPVPGGIVSAVHHAASGLTVTFYEIRG